MATPALCKEGEVRVCIAEGTIPRAHLWGWKAHDGSLENFSHSRVGGIHTCYTLTLFSWFGKLLQKVHHQIFEIMHPIDRFIEEGSTMAVVGSMLGGVRSSQAGGHRRANPYAAELLHSF